ncbi:protein Spindly isoform X2 [Sceloporus undulatus]|uniref:protein Spindly isoform X2 n=1 Tax=Sceloporus undulatus TaxID=8520 RepID=UPI001C4B83B0|nr:protein Spindly isoform X2 [Sceloporus undulatus]
METDADTISRLRCQLREAEEERRKAAQYGLKLVENENLLQNRLDELQNEIVALTENFEQEKYTLQREVELKNRMLGSLNLEYESLKQQQNVQLDIQREQLERVHGQEVNELKNKMEKLKSELDETLLSEKQLKHKVDHLKEVAASKSEELRMMSERVHETMSSEVLNLQLEVLALEQAKVGLEDKLHDQQYCKEQLELGNSNLTNRVARLEEEKEEREKDLVSYCNALEKAREMNRDLQVQLDHALQQALNPSSKGNSLFAEVEDRRADMERQLISLKVKYHLLQKQYAFTREQLQRLKLQMATLLRMKGSQGEHDQLERLQNMLQQKNGEIEELLMKVKQLEKPVISEESRELKLSNTSENVDYENGYYTDLLQMKLENSDKEIENVKSELSLQRMKALFESQRVLEMERKLYANERQLAACQSENINLHVLLDELKIKYEPEELMRDPVNLRKAPADILSESINSTMSSLCETSCMLSQSKEEAKRNDAGLKTTLQTVSMNIIPSQAMEQGNDQPEGKRVKIKEEEFDRTALNKKDGNDIGASHGTRSVSSNMYVRGKQHRPASLFFRCVNYAIHFFIYFLSIACSVIPQFQLPSLKFSKIFPKKISKRD